MGNWILISVGVVLVAAGLALAFTGRAETAGAGHIENRIALEGPAWLILVGIGIALIFYGTLRIDREDEVEIVAAGGVARPTFAPTASEAPPAAEGAGVAEAPVVAAATLPTPATTAAPDESPASQTVLLRSNGGVGDIPVGTPKATAVQQLAGLWGPPDEDRLLDNGEWKVRWGELNVVFTDTELLIGWQFVSHQSPFSRSGGTADTPAVAVEGDELMIEMTVGEFGQFDPQNFYPAGDELAVCELPNDTARPSDVVCAHFDPPLLPGQPLGTGSRILVLEAYG